ncbi:unnamed protein product, partial [Adineta steineri]
MVMIHLKTETIGTGAPAQDVVVTDINEDGRNDIIVVYSTNKVGVFSNNGDETFTTGEDVDLTESRAVRVRAADMDKDSKSDIIVAHRSGNISILFNNGDNTFTNKMIFSKNPVQSQSFKIADMNNDGLIDIIFADYLEHYQ